MIDGELLKQRLINTVKYSKLFYFLYYYLGSLAVNVLKIFVKPDDKLILFNSYAGRKYDDSPKVLFEAMRTDPRFSEYRFVWAFHEPEKYNVYGAKKIKTDTVQYFIIALKARIWITNSSVERGLNIKGKHTFYLNTWHGTPIKKMGSDIAQENKAFKSRGCSKVDIMLSQGEYETEIFSRTFGIPKDRFLKVGLPRNDELFACNEERIVAIKQKLQLPEGKRIILYAPTFREYCKGSKNEIIQEMRISFERWERKMGNEYVLLVRAHYESVKMTDFSSYSTIFDVSDYPYLNDLLLVSDALISDYSSIFFDYSILRRPMLCYAYDLERYNNNRGLYFNIEDELPCSISFNEDLLFEDIYNAFNHYEDFSVRTSAFQEKYVSAYGSATEKTCNYIARVLEL